MRYLIEVEICGPLERELRAADTVGGCEMIERMIQDGVRLNTIGWQDLLLTVRAMEHVTVPPKKMITIDEFGPIRGGMASDSGA